MIPFAFDPWREQRRLEWCNRLARWRHSPGESAFHAGIWLALAALLAWLALSAWQQHEASEIMGAAVRRWPWATLAMVLVAMTMAQSRRLRTLRDMAVRGWLHAQPVTKSAFTRRRIRALAAGCAVQCLAVAVMLAWLRLSALAWLAVLFASLVAAALAALLEGRRLAHDVHSGRRTLALRSRLADPGVGSVWRWQKIEAALALHGRGLAPGLFVLLLIPAGSGVFAIAASLIVAMLLAATTTAWQRMLAVFPAAQHWLGVQPMNWRDLMRDGVPLPLMLLLVACIAMGGLLFALGMQPLPSATVATLLFACGVLHLLAHLAERARPSRIALTATGHLVLLLCIVQSLPPAAPIFWLIQVIWLLRPSRNPMR